MIKIKFRPEDLQDDKKAFWEQWEAKARAATLKLIEDWEKWVSDPATKDKKFPSDNFDDTIWKELRDFLLKDVFYNKCAYCESFIIGFKAHAEHFRPKAQVRFKVTVGEKETYRMGKTLDETGAEIDHPGYFWLAYNWKNLLPSCQKCNALEGKKDQFPIAKSYVAVKKLAAGEIQNLLYKLTKRENTDDIFYLEPEDLDLLEDPQLLHPYFGEDPRAHLVFGIDGKVSPRNNSPRGLHSMKVFDLNDEDLAIARQDKQQNANREYMNMLTTVTASPLEARRKGEEVLAKYREGSAPYSSAVLDYIHKWFEGHRFFDPYITLYSLEENQNAGPAASR
jgi:hypothetical protein